MYLLDLILDSEINPVLLSSFVGALGMFGSENMGKIDEIIIKGLDIQMEIVNKYGLFLIAILDKDLVNEGIHKEAEKALDAFYTLYRTDIGDCIDISIFEPFKEALYSQIKGYFMKVNHNEDQSNIKDFGFFTQAIARLRNDNH
ncbi:MAG: hypothetical protein ACFFDP_05185 [Promethearchaeota archaeon]